jgi:hypothetical protein
MPPVQADDPAAVEGLALRTAARARLWVPRAQARSAVVPSQFGTQKSGAAEPVAPVPDALKQLGR